VHGDKRRIRQILVNLAGNAVQFSDVGEVRMAIQARAASGNVADILVTVRDTGPGIPESRIPYLFRAFDPRGDVPAEGQGLGLGLAVSKNLAEAMGGRIGAKNRAVGGSLFFLRLPLPMVVEAGPLEATAGTGLKVLLIEADHVSRELVQELLLRMGHRVEGVAESAKAQEKLVRERFDAVLLDADLLRVDGSALLAELHASTPPGTDMPIFAMTGLGVDPTELGAAGERLSGCLVRPINRQGLTQALDDVAKRSAAGPLDVGFLRRNHDGNHQLLSAVLALYIDQTPAERVELKRLMAAGKNGQAADLAHRLAGSSATIGAFGLRTLGLKLERVLIDGHIQKAAELLQAFTAEHDRVLEAVRSERSRHVHGREP
jgi:CheY-like chemotaxis protein